VSGERSAGANQPLAAAWDDVDRPGDDRGGGVAVRGALELIVGELDLSAAVGHVQDPVGVGYEVGGCFKAIASIRNRVFMHRNSSVVHANDVGL